MPGSTKGRRWVRVTVCVLLAGLVVGGFGFLLREMRRQASLEQRANDLRQIWITLADFNDVYKQLPSSVRRDEAGRPLSSWRFHILPFLESLMTPVDYSQPWDAPCQRWLAGMPANVYCHLQNDTSEGRETNVVAITGRGTAFEEDRPGRVGRLPRDLVLVIEVAHSGFHWMEPGDVDVDAIPASITAGLEGDGALVLFADSAVWHLSPDVPLEELKKFFTIEGAEQYERETVLAPYTIRRYYPRGDRS